MILAPRWILLNNSETVKAVTLAFCTPDIAQKSDGGVSDFQISGQSLYLNLLSSNLIVTCKNWKQNLKISNTALTLLL